MLLYEYAPLLKFCEEKIAEGKKLVVATIIGTNGSSYRKKWTSMVMAEDGSYAGALSGGCVEREVVRNSSKVFFTKKSLTFEYDGYNSLGCNGSIYVLVEFLDEQLFAVLSSKFSRFLNVRMPFERLIAKNITNNTFASGFKFDDQEIFLSDIKNEVIEQNTIHPNRRLIIFGNEIDGYTLNSLASQIGFESYSIISPRARKPEHENLNYIVAEPFDLSNIVPLIDKYSFILLMTHSKEKDAHLLPQLINLDYLYLGMLGPEHRKKEILDKTRSKLANTPQGVDKTKLDKVYGPIGMEIGATNPQEICISILGQLIAVSLR